MFGRLPSVHAAGLPVYSQDFPVGMATKKMYPTVSSLYVLPNGDEVNVACTSRTSVTAKARDCPSPFLQPTVAGSLETW